MTFGLPFRGVWCPSTLAATGSDLRRVCLTRLRGAFRFSQPLDASFLPQPLRFSFTPETPLGLSPSEVCSSTVAGRASRRDLPLLPFHHRPGSTAAAPGVCAPAESVHSNRFYPASERRTSLGGCSPPRCSPPRPRLPKKPPLMGFDMPLRGEPLIDMPALQSFKEPRCGLASFEATDLLGVLCPFRGRRTAVRFGHPRLRSLVPADKGHAEPLRGP